MRYIRANPKKWKLNDDSENFIFYGILKIKGYHQGRSAINFQMEDVGDDNNNMNLIMTLGHFFSMVGYSEQDATGTWAGYWTFYKQGTAISVGYLGDTLDE